MIGGTEMHLTSLEDLRRPVKAGEVVVEFDTTEQEYKLKEAEADLAEAEQHLIQADAERQAQEEEDAYALPRRKPTSGRPSLTSKRIRCCRQFPPKRTRWHSKPRRIT